jgi:phosphate transport system substrate-binding protein
MTYGQVQNAAGKFVSPSAASFQAAASHADWGMAKDFYLVMTNAPGADSYPITATTFIMMHKIPKDKQRSDAALKFFRWTLTKGQPQAEALDYVPIPADLAKQIDSYLTATIK